MRVKSTWDQLQSLMNWLLVLSFIAVPLAIWKAIDILLWIASKLTFTVGIK